jgi:hypothetical protein
VATGKSTTEVSGKRQSMQHDLSAAMTVTWICTDPAAQQVTCRPPPFYPLALVGCPSKRDAKCQADNPTRLDESGPRSECMKNQYLERMMLEALVNAMLPDNQTKIADLSTPLCHGCERPRRIVCARRTVQVG